MTVNSMQDERKAAAHRRRRIMYNNDGGDIRPAQAATPEGFLSLRTTRLVGTHVDTVLYCSHHSFGRCTHNTRTGEVGRMNPDETSHNNVLALIRQGRDCLQVVTDFCHEHGMEAFWSMRMNDIHDGKLPEIRSQFKKDHPEFLFGVEGDHRDDFIGEPRWWSAVDYEHPPVRDQAFRLIEEVCRNYDVDGVELDYFRHPFYFKQYRRGLPAEPHQIELMTDFMRRLHAMTVEASQARGRPVLVSVRVPDAIRICLHIGLDIETWAKEGLIDMLACGGYYHVAAWEEMIDLGHAHDIPVYPCLSATRVRGRAQGAFEREDPIWRGEALNVWAAGGDGLYVFNHFEGGSRAVLEMGDPDGLRKLSRVYAPNHGSIDKFLGDRAAAEFGFLPLAIAKGESRSAAFKVGEKVPDDPDAKLTLRLRFSRFSDADDLQVTLNGASLSGVKISPLNGQTLSSADVRGIPGCWVECPVQASAVREGDNEVTVTCTALSGPQPITFQDVQLEITPVQ